MKIKEQDIIDLGFERVDDNDNGDPYHYYTLDIGHDYVPMCLITNSSDEAKANDGNWSVTIFDYDIIEFTDLVDLKKIVSLLKNNVKDKK